MRDQSIAGVACQNTRLELLKTSKQCRRRTKTALEALDGKKYQSLGVIRTRVKNTKTGKEDEVEFQVVKDPNRAIIGKETAEKMGIIKIDHKKVSAMIEEGDSRKIKYWKSTHRCSTQLQNQHFAPGPPTSYLAPPAVPVHFFREAQLRLA